MQYVCYQHTQLSYICSQLQANPYGLRKAEKLSSLESHIFLESTGIYHFPLFCYLVDYGFHASIINPIITHSSKNGNIRKVKNDIVDSKGIAKLGLSDDIPVSQFPAKLILELRSLTRKYYDLTDERSAHINKRFQKRSLQIHRTL
ncbi:MAG: transposase [Candidatus Fimimorpha sp.]